MVIVDINSEVPANVRLSTGDLAAFIATGDAVLISDAKAAIRSAYGIGPYDVGPGAGFKGEHDTGRM